MKKFFQRIDQSGKDVSSIHHSTNFIGKSFVVGKYNVTVEDTIAEGGFAIVFLVKASTGTRFALKRMYVNNETDLQIARNEISIAKLLNGSRTIVGYVDSSVMHMGNDIHEVLLLMTYYKKHLLHLLNERLNSGLTEKEVVKIFCDICEAVSKLHQVQPPIIHRDLKVENVLVNSEGDYILCDFGSATQQVLRGSVHGISYVEDEIQKYTTVSYRAPEMVDLYLDKPISSKSDIWALGCFLYKICFFVLPFGESPLAITSGNFSIPETINKYSKHVTNLIKFMLEPDPDLRPNIVQVSHLAFSLANVDCPLRNTQNSVLYTLDQLGDLLKDRERKNVVPAVIRPTSTTPLVEGTSVAPRQRPKGSSSLGVAAPGISSGNASKSIQPPPSPLLIQNASAKRASTAPTPAADAVATIETPVAAKPREGSGGPPMPPSSSSFSYERHSITGGEAPPVGVGSEYSEGPPLELTSSRSFVTRIPVQGAPGIDPVANTTLGLEGQTPLFASGERSKLPHHGTLGGEEAVPSESVPRGSQDGLESDLTYLTAIHSYPDSSFKRIHRRINSDSSAFNKHFVSESSATFLTPFKKLSLTVENSTEINSDLRKTEFQEGEATWNPFNDAKPFGQMSEDCIFGEEFDRIRYLPPRADESADIQFSEEDPFASAPFSYSRKTPVRNAHDRHAATAEAVRFPHQERTVDSSIAGESREERKWSDYEAHSTTQANYIRPPLEDRSKYEKLQTVHDGSDDDQIVASESILSRENPLRKLLHKHRQPHRSSSSQRETARKKPNLPDPTSGAGGDNSKFSALNHGGGGDVCSREEEKEELSGSLMAAVGDSGRSQVVAFGSQIMASGSRVVASDDDEDSIGSASDLKVRMNEDCCDCDVYYYEGADEVSETVSSSVYQAECESITTHEEEVKNSEQPRGLDEDGSSHILPPQRGPKPSKAALRAHAKAKKERENCENNTQDRLLGHEYGDKPLLLDDELDLEDEDKHDLCERDESRRNSPNGDTTTNTSRLSLLRQNSGDQFVTSMVGRGREEYLGNEDIFSNAPFDKFVSCCDNYPIEEIASSFNDFEFISTDIVTPPLSFNSPTTTDHQNPTMADHSTHHLFPSQLNCLDESKLSSTGQPFTRSQFSSAFTVTIDGSKTFSNPSLVDIQSQSSSNPFLSSDFHHHEVRSFSNPHLVRNESSILTGNESAIPTEYLIDTNPHVDNNYNSITYVPDEIRSPNHVSSRGFRNVHSSPQIQMPRHLPDALRSHLSFDASQCLSLDSNSRQFCSDDQDMFGSVPFKCEQSGAFTDSLNTFEAVSAKLEKHLSFFPEENPRQENNEAHPVSLSSFAHGAAPLNHQQSPLDCHNLSSESEEETTEKYNDVRLVTPLKKVLKSGGDLSKNRSPYSCVGDEYESEYVLVLPAPRREKVVKKGSKDQSFDHRSEKKLSKLGKLKSKMDRSQMDSLKLQTETSEGISNMSFEDSNAAEARALGTSNPQGANKEEDSQDLRLSEGKLFGSLKRGINPFSKLGR